MTKQMTAVLLLTASQLPVLTFVVATAATTVVTVLVCVAVLARGHTRRRAARDVLTLLLDRVRPR